VVEELHQRHDTYKVLTRMTEDWQRQSKDVVALGGVHMWPPVGNSVNGAPSPPIGSKWSGGIKLGQVFREERGGLEHGLPP
jgi:hypothetical protein